MAPPRLDLRGFDGICLRVLGDGKRRAPLVRTNEADDDKAHTLAGRGGVLDVSA
jgi:hypothetical protein